MQKRVVKLGRGSRPDLGRRNHRYPRTLQYFYINAISQVDGMAGHREEGVKGWKGASGWPVGREDVFFHPFLAINLLAGN